MMSDYKNRFPIISQTKSKDKNKNCLITNVSKLYGKTSSQFNFTQKTFDLNLTNDNKKKPFFDPDKASSNFRNRENAKKMRKFHDYNKNLIKKIEQFEKFLPFKTDELRNKANELVGTKQGKQVILYKFNKNFYNRNLVKFNNTQKNETNNDSDFEELAKREFEEIEIRNNMKKNLNKIPTNYPKKKDYIHQVLNQVYRIDDDFIGKLKKAQTQKNLPLEIYQRNLVSLLKDRVSIESMNDLTKKFHIIQEQVHEIPEISPFKIEDHFNPDKIIKNLNHFSYFETEKRRNERNKKDEKSILKKK